MLSKQNYSEDHIRDLHIKIDCDSALLERVVFAFGLLEAITSTGLPFCFKGGTSLLLLLEKPYRLSTDIDIIVNPGTDINEYIKKAGEIFPFKEVSEHIRTVRNNIEKRHFKFTYASPLRNREVTILLDVLIENIKYEKTVTRPIRNSFLITEGNDLSVTIPDIDNILGDKLTAFAPHTTGIPFGIDKELEIIKQFYDCVSLFDQMLDLSEVKTSFRNIAEAEMSYRELDLSPEEILEDTLKACLCIASRGATDSADYRLYLDGISRIRSHIIGSKFSGEIAGARAGRLLYLLACLLTDRTEIMKFTDEMDLSAPNLPGTSLKRFNYLKTVDRLSYKYLAEAINLLSETEYIHLCT